MVKELVLLHGCFRLLFLYDVAEALDLERVRDLVGSRGGPVPRAFPRRTPEYVRFEHAPIAEYAEPLTLGGAERFACSIRYYGFAVVVVQLEAPFNCDWPALISQASRWMDDPEATARAREIARLHLQRVAPAILRPHADWLEEDYLIVNLQETGLALPPEVSPGNAGKPGADFPPASELLSKHGAEIAQLIRGELSPLASTVTEEILGFSTSYYPSDLVVVGSSAAMVYERSEDAVATDQVLEYAKMQLLEFRYYDALMTRLLSEVYDTLEEKRNFLLQRWTLPRDAKRFNTIRLDVMELTERVDNAIKFVSDVYYARIYRLAAGRVGLPEYRSLVEEKLRTVGELYDFMVDQFNEARSFVLEVGVAVLALLDVIFLLRGK